MTVFFIAAAVLLLTALALVAYPLFRRHENRSEPYHDDVVRLSRERLDELKAQKHNGEISESEYAERVSDLEAQLSDDLHAQGRPAAGRGGGRWMGVAALVLIPVLSGVVYLHVGSPEALLPGAGQRAAGPDAGDLQPGDIEAMVARLAERLAENPDDAEGWFMLGRSYMVLDRYDEAAEAFSRLRALVGDVPDVLVSEATALAMARNGALSGEPTRLVQRALEQQPDHAQALWIAATAAYQVGDNETAMEYYRRVEPMLEGDQLQQVRGMIEQLVGTGVDQGANDVATSLRVNVKLSPSLRDDAGDGDTVFIFARAVGGPPMPLAAVRKSVADLPVTVTLDDSRSLSPQHKLSEFDRVTVAARISRSGEPAARPGDLEGGSGPVATDTSQMIEIVIDRVVPEEE